MKVLLTVPPPSDMSIRSFAMVLFEPLALEYLGAAVQDNHEVKLLDQRVKTEPSLKETLESFQPDIIASGSFTQEVNSVKKMFAKAKKLKPDILTVVGGFHATMMPEELFEDTIDVVVVGEGVHPFKKICDYHEQGKSFQDIGNIYYRNGNASNGKMAFTHREPYPELDTLPFPNRKLTAHLRDFFQLRLLINKPLRMASSRGSVGCFYRCNFCSVTKLTGAKLFRHSIDRIVEELSTIEEPLIFWSDDEFMIEPERSLELARTIEKAGIKKYHYVSARSDTIIRNPELVEAWARNGLIFVFLGLEAFREEDLKRLKKTTSIEKNEGAIRILHANNVKIQGGFIIRQDFSKEDFRALTDYVRGLGLYLPNFFILTPLPGTDVWKETKDDIFIHDYDMFDMIHTVLPTKLPLKQFYKEYTRLFVKAVPFSQKIKTFKHLDPPTRKKIVANTRMLLKYLKNMYKMYDKHYR